VSNTRRVKPPPRPPDEIEAAFLAALRQGCPHRGSRRVIERFRNGMWDYGLRCDPSCRTFTEPQLAHRLASEAARRAAVATGQKLRHEAFDGSSGQIEGAVRALAGAGTYQ
jgi:hypothetical protein